MSNKPHRLSFEFYPPKTQQGRQHLQQTAYTLKNFSPNFFSVTFGAGGSTRSGTLETVTMLKQQTHIEIAPHLSCIGLTKPDLISLLQEYKQLDVKRIVAIRGDLPSGMVANGEYKLAEDFIKLIRAEHAQHFHIEVAAYPEFHPQAKTALDDVANLKRKSQAGANSAITQYFYNADAYFYLLDECAKQKIDLPIVPGIMPIMDFSKLVRFSEVCGAEIPRWLLKRLEAHRDDQAAVHQLGIEIVVDLCERLLAGGAPGLHFYTLNHANPCTEILQGLKITATEKIYHTA